VWIEVQIESRNSEASLIPECCADAAGTCQVAMTQMRQHLSHDVIRKTLQAAAAGQVVKVMRTRRRAQRLAYRLMRWALVSILTKLAPQACAEHMKAEYAKKKKSWSTRKEQQDTQISNLGLVQRSQAWKTLDVLQRAVKQGSRWNIWHAKLVGYD